MSQSDQEPDSDYTQMTVPDEELPEDLRAGDHNPLAGDADDEAAERQDLGDPHIEGLERDDDDSLGLRQSDEDGED
jgi:hypothetical protein